MKKFVYTLIAVSITGNLLAQQNLGVDQPNPQAKIHVTNTDSQKSLIVEDEASDATPFVIDSVGNVGVKTTAPSTDFEVNGHAKVDSITISNGGANGYVLTSDTAGNASWQPVLPAGVIMPYGGITPPPGWTICDGHTESRTGQAALFVAISVAYGAGDGSTTYNVPDLRQRFALGKAAAGTGSTLGGTGGGIDHTHTYTGVIAHTHSVNPPNTGTNSAGNHTHTWSGADIPYAGGGGSDIIGYRTTSPNPVNVGTSTAGSHTHTVDIASFTSGSTGSASGTTASENPPYLVVNYIIKY